MNNNSLRSLECSVCLQPFSNPVKLPCGHSFCFLCVKGVATNNHNCALCRLADDIVFNKKKPN